MVRRESLRGRWIANSGYNEEGMAAFKMRVARALRIPWNTFILMEPMGVRRDGRGRVTIPGPVLAQNLLGIQAAGAVGVLVLDSGETLSTARINRAHADTTRSDEDHLVTNVTFQILRQLGVPFTSIQWAWKEGPISGLSRSLGREDSSAPANCHTNSVLARLPVDVAHFSVISWILILCIYSFWTELIRI